MVKSRPILEITRPEAGLLHSRRCRRPAVQSGLCSLRLTGAGRRPFRNMGAAAATDVGLHLP